MAKAYDATANELIERHPRDWLALAGLPVPAGAAVRVVDADLSTVTTAADKVILVGGPEPYLAHLELQSASDGTLDLRVLAYNALLRLRHGLPVRSVAFLLRPAALPAGVTGRVHDAGPWTRLAFEYELVRVWELPPSLLLAGGLGVVPLAPIGAVAGGEAELGAVVGQMTERLERDGNPGDVGGLEAAAAILMGLRYTDAVVQRLLHGVRKMKDSSVYQAILAEGVEQGIERGRAEGRADGVRASILLLGGERLGPPDDSARAALAAVADEAGLQRLLRRVVAVPSWHHLFEPAE